MISVNCKWVNSWRELKLLLAHRKHERSVMTLVAAFLPGFQWRVTGLRKWAGCVGEQNCLTQSEEGNQPFWWLTNPMGSAHSNLSGIRKAGVHGMDFCNSIQANSMVSEKVSSPQFCIWMTDGECSLLSDFIVLKCSRDRAGHAQWNWSGRILTFSNLGNQVLFWVLMVKCWQLSHMS